jgi:hypothetical protein
MIFKKNLYIIFPLILLSLLAHHYIFTDNNILSAGDWVYFYPESSKSLMNFLLYLKPFGFGELTPFPNNWVFYAISSILFNLGFDWDFFTRSVFLVPIIILTPITSFILFLEISQNRYSAFISSILYTYNSFFLKLQLDWITYGNIWWILPALLFLQMKFLSTKRLVYLPVISFLFALGMVYEIRIMIIVGAFLLLHLICHLFFNKTTTYKQYVLILLSIISSIILHSFWMLPFAFGSIYSDIISNASPSLFYSFYSILDIFTLRSYQWSTGLVYEPFIIQPIDYHKFIIPIITIIGLISLSHSKKILKELKASLLLSLVIFLFLSKQANIPFDHIYEFFFKNFPLFNLYRESSKFIIISSLTISLFFGLGVIYVYRKLAFLKTLVAKFFITFVFIFIMSNTLHFITQQIGGMTKGVTIPKEDQYLKEYMINQNYFFRTLWYPFKPRFTYSSNLHPFILPSNLKFDIKNTDSVTLNNYFDYLSIKYIIVPPKRIEKVLYGRNNVETKIEGFRYYGSREDFISDISKLSFMNKIKDIGGYTIFVNNNFFPNIYSSSSKLSLSNNVAIEPLKYFAKTSTSYQIKLKNIKNNTYIHFSDNYSSNWTIIAESSNAFRTIIANRAEKPIISSTKNVFGSNSFYINLNEIKKKYSNYDLSVNKDGSINLNLHLYFKPQAFATIGLIISFTFLSILFFSFFYFLTKEYVKNKK